MTDKLLREAAQNILNGIETGAIKIETDQDESWANALSALRSALAQSESEPDKLEKAARAIYDMMPFDGVGSEKKPAWVEGGNSLKQDEARRYARAALAEAQQGEGDGPALKCPNPDCLWRLLAGVQRGRVASKGESLPHLSRREAMTQDEREQKMEAYNPSQYETITQANNRMSAELSRLKAMTEGGVWVSRKDAAFIADSLETTAPLIAKVCTPEGFTAKARSLSIAARIRAKLEGNHDT
jgi:hypothetical protein